MPINIALMAGSAPVLGIIAAPALGLIWRGIVGRGAERVAFAPDGNARRRSPIHTRPRPQGELVVLVSRSHLEPRTQTFLDGLPKARTVPCGSAVKFCRVAEGSADLYPRLAPTRDWDVAAGHALVEAAGGQLRTPDGAPLVYGTPDLRIPGFIARAILQNRNQGLSARSRSGHLRSAVAKPALAPDTKADSTAATQAEAANRRSIAFVFAVLPS